MNCVKTKTLQLTRATNVIPDREDDESNLTVIIKLENLPII